MSSANIRIQWLHKRILDGSFPNAQRLSERFGISHRQAQRDLEFLKKELGAPLIYNSKKKGFSYSGAYSLPVLLTSYNDDLYIPDIANVPDEESIGAQESIIQMQLPYTATLEFTDKLSAIELSSFIRSAESKTRFICEFHSVEKFLGVLFSTSGGFKVIEPDWLREKVIAIASSALKNNQ